MADVDPEKDAIPEKEHSVRRSCRVFCVLLVCFLGIAIVITSIMFHVICPGCPPKKIQEMGLDGNVRLRLAGDQPAKLHGRITSALGGILERCFLLPEDERQECRKRNKQTRDRVEEEKAEAKEKAKNKRQGRKGKRKG